MKLENKIKRFWSMVGDPTETGCREWQGNTTDAGCGILKGFGGRMLAHRFSAFIAGLIDNPRAKDHCRGDDLVLHTCDNPVCVEPKHLFIGTQLNNMQDRNTKGRAPKQDKILTPKLGEEINFMYEVAGLSQDKVAAILGVSQGVVSKWLRGVYVL